MSFSQLWSSENMIPMKPFTSLSLFFGSFLPCCHKWQTAEIWKAWPWLLGVKLCFSGDRLRFLCQGNLQKNLEIGDEVTLEFRAFLLKLFLSIFWICLSDTSIRSIYITYLIVGPITYLCIFASCSTMSSWPPIIWSTFKQAHVQLINVGRPCRV